MDRRRILYTIIAAPFLGGCGVARTRARETVRVFKDASCGCCGKWVEHLRANGFVVDVQDVAGVADYSRRYGVPSELRSCHTGVIGTYTIEGHVPAADIQRLLRDRPDAKGLAVPGMPIGSPGMEGARRQAYSVLLFTADGRTSTFQRYPAQAG